MNKILLFALLLSCLSVTAMEQKKVLQEDDLRLWHQRTQTEIAALTEHDSDWWKHHVRRNTVDRDQLAIQQIPQKLVRAAAIDCLEKPGTFLPQLRLSTLILKELVGKQKQPLHETLVRLIMFRHIGPDAIAEDNDTLKMDYHNNCRPDLGFSVPDPLLYNEQWQKTPYKSYADVCKEEKTGNFFAQRNAFRSLPSTAPLGQKWNDLNYYDGCGKKPRSEFENSHPDKALTKNLHEFCSKVSGQPIVFNARYVFKNAHDLTSTQAVDFTPHLTHLNEEEQKQLAPRLLTGIGHLAKFQSWLQKQPDRTSTVVDMQKKLVPAMLAVWQKTLALNPFTEKPTETDHKKHLTV